MFHIFHGTVPRVIAASVVPGLFSAGLAYDIYTAGRTVVPVAGPETTKIVKVPGPTVTKTAHPQPSKTSSPSTPGPTAQQAGFGNPLVHRTVVVKPTATKTKVKVVKVPTTPKPSHTPKPTSSPGPIKKLIGKLPKLNLLNLG